MLATINGFDFLLACTITALLVYVAILRDSIHSLRKQCKELKKVKEYSKDVIEFHEKFISYEGLWDSFNKFYISEYDNLSEWECERDVDPWAPAKACPSNCTGYTHLGSACI